MKIADMHCDTISELFAEQEKGKKVSLFENNKMVDLKRQKNSNYLIQNYALFVNQKQISMTPLEEVKRLIAFFKQQMEQNQNLVSQVYNLSDVMENEKKGKLSALLTVEEGGVCEGSLENLYYLYEQGVRMMTITWNYPNELGYPNYNENGDMYTPDILHGLTVKGIEFVEEMENLGMIIDVSHLSDAGFYDVLNHTKKPFVASHSNARGRCRAARNLSDDMIRSLGQRGGVAGLNFSVDFLREHTGAGNKDARNPANWGLGYASLLDIAEHAKYMANVGGIECVGLGSDFDGIPRHPELAGIEEMYKLLEAFQRAGFHESEIDKICCQNVMRVYREVLV